MIFCYVLIGILILMFPDKAYAQTTGYIPHYMVKPETGQLQINPYRPSLYYTANQLHDPRRAPPVTPHASASRWPIGYNKPLVGQSYPEKAIKDTYTLGTAQPAIAPNIWDAHPPSPEELDRRAENARTPLVSEIKGSILQHDASFIGSRKESGIDLSTEILFRSPGFMDLIGAPRPHIGLVINTSGGTNVLYGGLAWQWDDLIWDGFFAALSLGMSVHDGKLTTFEPGAQGEKEFGSRMLFREALEIGYRFNEHHSLSFVVDHFSNANIESNNEGLDSYGIRYGYRF